MRIKLLKDCDVPMASWHTNCECCGPQRYFPDVPGWFPKGEEFNPDEGYQEIDLNAHKDTFKFGEHYTIIAYP